VRVVEKLRTAHRAPAKGRILDCADRLFYEEGIRTVGVDRLITESSVTKATFYKHYRAKDNLIVAYITNRHHTVRDNIEGIIAGAPDAEIALRRLVEAVGNDIDAPGFRGCPFINAAAEFANPLHPVRQVVTMHREWYTETIGALLRDAGHPAPGDAADEFLLVRDGALAGGYAGDAIAASAAMSRLANRVLDGVAIVRR